MIFATKVNGIPCFCRVDHYLAGRPDKFMHGAMEDAEEGYDEEFEFTMLDHRHVIAPWIRKQMNDNDFERMLEEFHTTVLEEKHLYGADDHDR